MVHLLREGSLQQGRELKERQEGGREEGETEGGREGGRREGGREGGRERGRAEEWMEKKQCTMTKATMLKASPCTSSKLSGCHIDVSEIKRPTRAQ